LSASNIKLSTEGGYLCLDDANYQAIARQLSEREIQRLRIAKGSNEEASSISAREIKLRYKVDPLRQGDANGGELIEQLNEKGMDLARKRK
jgi:ActR/RegA family two-component response regulator